MPLKDNLRQHQIPIALFLISFLAFALRIYQLDTESLWLDEVLSINLASMDIPSAIYWRQKRLDKSPSPWCISVSYTDSIFCHPQPGKAAAPIDRKFRSYPSTKKIGEAL